MLQAGVRSRGIFAAKSELFQFQPNTGICSIFFVFCLYQQNLQPSVSSSQVHELITLPQAPCFMFFCPALVGWTSYQPSGCSCLYMLFLSPAGWMDFLPALFVFYLYILYRFFIQMLFLSSAGRFNFLPSLWVLSWWPKKHCFVCSNFFQRALTRCGNQEFVYIQLHYLFLSLFLK